jgi:hypothetical protein
MYFGGPGVGKQIEGQVKGILSPPLGITKGPRAHDSGFLDPLSFCQSSVLMRSSTFKFFITHQLGCLCVFLSKCLKGAGIVPAKRGITLE